MGRSRQLSIRLRRLVDRMPRSLLVRLTTSFLAFALVIVLLTALAAFLRARAVLRREILARLDAVAVVKEHELTLWIADQRRDLEFVASLPTMRELVPALAAAPDGPAASAARRRLTAVLDSAGSGAIDAREVFVLSAVGARVLVSTDSARVGDYRVDDQYFARALRHPYVQNVYPSPTTGRPTMTIATAVRGLDGEVRAVLAAHLDMARMDEILAERAGLGTTGEAYLVSQFNDFVSGERFGRAEARRGVHTLGVREALSGENGAAAYLNYMGVPVLGAWRWIAPRQMALLVETHAAEALAPARQLVTTILLIGLAAALLLALGVFLIARRIAQPVMAVADAAQRVAAGDFDAVAPATTRDEVGQLAHAFNAMTARLRGVYVDLSRQVDETQAALAALKESQQLLQAVMDNSAALVMVLDRDGRFLLVNRRFEELFGRRNPAIRGSVAAAVLPGEAAFAVDAAAHSALRGEPVVERDAELRLGDVVHHYHFVAFPLAEPGRPPFGAGIVGTDLSERARAEEERRRLEAGVQQAQKLESLGLLAGGIAHDFNNILTAIVGGTTLALDTLPHGSPARTDLEQVVAAAERAAKLTRQMLAYAGRASFAQETFDLNAVIREMAELIAVSVPKSVRLTEELSAGLPPLRADRTQVSQIVLNLITNAAEATSPRAGQVTLRTARHDADQLRAGDWRFAPGPAPAFVELAVRDDGVGMSADTAERIFDPFFSTKGSGRGLGLAAVLGIVRRAGGTLRVETAPGAGTTFRVLFPAATGAAVEVPAAPPGPGALAGSGTVLLVDDEATIRRATRRALERAGYNVVEAADGAQAVETFRTEGRVLSAVVLDVTMPIMGGAEAFRRMREMGPLVPVLVSSGYDEQDTAGAFTGGAVDFLQKPYRPEMLLTKLKGLMGSVVER